jgi:UDP-GlcNAc3NAcA epimerase
MIDLISIVGARPQFIKAAVVSRALAAHGGIAERLIHTGQHHDEALSAIFFRELQTPEPTFHLGVSGGGHGDMTGRMMIALEPILNAQRPRAVLVYGDTNSTLAGALTAAKLHIPVIHVEAGIRSFNRRMPEEVNRVLTDQVSALLLAPTRLAVRQLAAEGITAGVQHIGDVTYDAALHAIALAPRHRAVMDQLGVTDGAYSLATLHRAESTDDVATLSAMLAFIAEAGAGAGGPVIVPLHPRTRAAISAAGLSAPRLTFIDPVGYFDMHALIAGARLILTDSGGLQKEAYFHRKPCITLRSDTEWPETIEAGWNRLWQGPDWVGPRREIDDFGTGQAGAAAAAAIAKMFA